MGGVCASSWTITKNHCMMHGQQNVKSCRHDNLVYFIECNSGQQIFVAVCHGYFFCSYFSCRSAAISYSNKTLLCHRRLTKRTGLFARDQLASNCVPRGPLKADSHIACRAHAMSCRLFTHAMPQPCHAPTVPCPS